MSMSKNSSLRVVVTFGTFDLFHIGHKRILERAAALGDRLVVGVSSDAFNVRKKGRPPFFPEKERMEIVGALSFVDGVFLEESMEQKPQYLQDAHASVFVMGDDWKGRFDEDARAAGIEAVYMPRTPDISTTELLERIRTTSPAPS